MIQACSIVWSLEHHHAHRSASTRLSVSVHGSEFSIYNRQNRQLATTHWVLVGLKSYELVDTQPPIDRYQPVIEALLKSTTGDAFWLCFGQYSESTDSIGLIVHDLLFWFFFFNQDRIYIHF